MAAIDYYFCSAPSRPDCLLSTNTCCLHCKKVMLCSEKNKSKVKPCNSKVQSLDEDCPYSI